MFDPGLFQAETLNRGPMTIFQNKLLTMTDCDEAGGYFVPNVLSPRDLVFRPDRGHKLYHHRISLLDFISTVVFLTFPIHVLHPSLIKIRARRKKHKKSKLITCQVISVGQYMMLVLPYFVQ